MSHFRWGQTGLKANFTGALQLKSMYVHCV